MPVVASPNKALQTDRGPFCVSETFSSARAAAAERIVRRQEHRMQLGPTILRATFRTSFVMLFSVIIISMACTPSQPTKAQILGHSIKANGRLVVARLPAPSTIQQEGENIVLTSGPHKIVIERECIVLDGVELAKIPADTVNINVALNESRLLTIDREFKVLIKMQLE